MVLLALISSIAQVCDVVPFFRMCGGIFLSFFGCAAAVQAVYQPCTTVYSRLQAFTSVYSHLQAALALIWARGNPARGISLYHNDEKLENDIVLGQNAEVSSKETFLFMKAHFR